jgi:L-fuculose-phosphate aldolase
VPEIYVGTKFRTRFAHREAPVDGRLGELAEACRRMAAAGLAPEGAGNASLRTAAGFLVTRTAADLAGLGPGDFVEVLACDLGRAELVVQGAHEPSSESMLHAGVYGARPDAGAVLHGHCDSLLERAEALELPITRREQPYGTAQLVGEVLEVLDGHALVVIRGHGFIAIGSGPADAWSRVEEALARLAVREPPPADPV